MSEKTYAERAGDLDAHYDRGFIYVSALRAEELAAEADAEIAALRATVAGLLEVGAALQRDAERWRWIEQRGARVLQDFFRAPEGTLREFVDAAIAAPEAPSDAQDTARDDFLKGVCVSLSVMQSFDYGVAWGELVRTVGVEDMLHYATFVEPEEWELAGFNKYARQELRRDKPRKPRAAIAASEAGKGAGR